MAIVQDLMAINTGATSSRCRSIIEPFVWSENSSFNESAIQVVIIFDATLSTDDRLDFPWNENDIRSMKRIRDIFCGFRHILARAVSYILARA